MTNRFPASLISIFSTIILTLLTVHTRAQQVGSFFTAIYIEPNSNVPNTYVSCASMGYSSYCCENGACALDGSSQIACCPEGMTCSGWGATSSYNNGQWATTTTASYYTSAAAWGGVCANPCGYYKQLCCSADQYCYTDSNEQAQCGAGTQATTTAVVGVVGAQTVTTTVAGGGGYVVTTTTAGAVAEGATTTYETTTAVAAGETTTGCDGGETVSVLTENGNGLPTVETSGCYVLNIVSAGQGSRVTSANDLVMRALGASCLVMCLAFTTLLV